MERLEPVPERAGHRPGNRREVPEVDDDDPTRFGSMETGTYTKVRQEADDEDAMFALTELQTKTEVQQERDDEAVAAGW